MKINNFVKINGEYVPTSELTDEQMKEISEEILGRFAEKMGYKREYTGAV
ncbi:MAG: hypothetical protein MR304_09915 [Eubacterium sp.]|nr:hypothetical protein [Eubacterium sp.]